MTDISIETVEQCRGRGGDSAEDRDDSIDTVLVSDTIGYNEGEPLVEGVTTHQEYPSRSELADPRTADFLRRLFSHDLIGSIEDATRELTGVRDESTFRDWVSDLEASAELHGIDTDSLFEDSREEPDTKEVVSEVLGYEVGEGMLDSNNPLLLSALYVEGLSVDEIAEVLEVGQTDVRDRLKSVGLLRGKTTSEQTEAFRENKGRTSYSSSSTVDLGAVEDNDGVELVTR
ncbi:hypothetical protein [Halorubrum halophilum]|uniref:hypothetical protein n=1 Tax=Halorubrum halophilum TaxID=413816 RepID=UPI00186AE8DD|nr:hypothetical protein [Halorubrum halophilum]